MLEQSLWQNKTRFNKEYMEKIFHEDFFEFGRSGKTYTRAECLNVESQEILAKIPLENFKVHEINEHTVLITYISEVTYDTLQRGNRSSLWVKQNNEWLLRFHQGTPVLS